MLQVIKRTTIRHRGNHGSELQRSHRDSVAEGAHPANAAQLGIEFLVGINAEMFAFNVVSGQLAESELSRVTVNALKSELTSQRLEVKIVRFRQRLSKSHVGVRTDLHRRIARDDPFAQGSKSDG